MWLLGSHARSSRKAAHAVVSEPSLQPSCLLIKLVFVFVFFKGGSQMYPVVCSFSTPELSAVALGVHTDLRMLRAGGLFSLQPLQSPTQSSTCGRLFQESS